LRQHLEVIERTSGVTPEQLIPLPCPIEIEYLWGWFGEMCRMRHSNGMGVCRLSDEILTWQSLAGMKLTPFELDTIWQLDEVYVSHHSKPGEGGE
jgi:hypothetical protein